MWYGTTLLTRGENAWFPDFMATRVSGEWAVLGGELSLEGVVGGEKVSKSAGTSSSAVKRKPMAASCAPLPNDHALRSRALIRFFFFRCKSQPVSA